MTDAGVGGEAATKGESVQAGGRGKGARRKPAAKAERPGGQSAERGAMLDQLLGQVARLMAASPSHKHHFLSDLEWLVMPPLALGQARLLRDAKGNPLAFACWALVSEEVEKRLEAGHPRLAPQEWRSGDRLWLIDVVAPEPALPNVLATLQREVFKGARVRTIKRGSRRAVGNERG